jgi:hypothetical protein
MKLLAHKHDHNNKTTRSFTFLSTIRVCMYVLNPLKWRFLLSLILLYALLLHYEGGWVRMGVSMCLRIHKYYKCYSACKHELSSRLLAWVYKGRKENWVGKVDLLSCWLSLSAFLCIAAIAMFLNFLFMISQTSNKVGKVWKRGYSDIKPTANKLYLTWL